MEKLPQFERPEPRVVGKVPAERKEEFAREIREHFGDKHYFQFPEMGAKLKAIEYEKQPPEREFVARANEITNNLLARFGLKPFDIPEQNFHIIPHKYFTETARDAVGAATLPMQQTVILDAEELRNRSISMANTILHETIHLKGYTAFQTKDDGADQYRFGLTTLSTYRKDERAGPYKNFRGLNEAVTEEINKRYFDSMLLVTDRGVRDDVARMHSDKAKEEIGKIAKAKKVSPDEIYWVDEKGDEEERYTYRPQRAVLNFMVDEIYKDNPDRFISRDEAMDLFFGAYFTGRIYELGKIVEKSFGDGSFREIGSMDDDHQSGWRILETLRRKRRVPRK